MPAATSAFTAAGTALHVCAALPATLTKTAYAALTWVAVGEVTDGGSIGRTYNQVSHQPLATRGVVKLKGSFDDGTIQVQAAYAPGDAGQVIVAAALLSDNFYSFKFTLQDGTIIYFEAQVQSAPVNIGGVDAVVGTTYQLAVKSGTLVYAFPA